MNLYGLAFATAAPLIFAASIPLAANLFLKTLDPWLLAGLLDLGAGLGLLPLYVLSQKNSAQDSNGLPRTDMYNVGMSILTGGVVAPVLFILSLTGGAAEASVLLALEAPFTAFFAMVMNKERMTALRIASTAFIMASSAILAIGAIDARALAAVASALMYGMSHVYTARIAERNLLQIATWKLLISGGVNVGINLMLGREIPVMTTIAWVLLSGFVCNGISYLLYLRGLRELGAMLAGSIFSLVPVFGAAFLVIFFIEPLTVRLAIACILMLIGLLLLLVQQRASELIRSPHSDTS